MSRTKPAPEYEANLENRATAIVDDMPALELRKLTLFFSMSDEDYIRQPYRTEFPGIPTANEHAAAKLEAGRRARSVAIRHIKEQLRAADTNTANADPAHLERDRRWAEYTRGVTAVAFSQGDKEQAFVAKWLELVAARAEAEKFGDDADIARIDRRLEAHVGIPYPCTTPDAGTKTSRRPRLTTRPATAANTR